MSNVAIQSAALVSLPGGIAIPAAAPFKAARDCAKKLFQLAGESALASGKVSSEQIYAFGLGLAILGAVDNQSAPLERVKAYMGEKPNKKAAERLQYWINCTAAGKAAWKNGADSVDLLGVVSHADVAALSAAALEKAAADKKAAAALEAEKEANQKRIEATEEAAARIATEAARKAEEAAAAIHAAAYAENFTHGVQMENGAAEVNYRNTEEAAALAAARKAEAEAEAARKAAWLEAAAAATVADVMTNKAKAAAAFSSLATALGIDLTADQKAALVSLVAEQGQAAAYSAERAEAAARAKAEAAAASEQAALVAGMAKTRKAKKAA